MSIHEYSLVYFNHCSKWYQRYLWSAVYRTSYCMCLRLALRVSYYLVVSVLSFKRSWRLYLPPPICLNNYGWYLDLSLLVEYITALRGLGYWKRRFSYNAQSSFPWNSSNNWISLYFDKCCVLGIVSKLVYKCGFYLLAGTQKSSTCLSRVKEVFKQVSWVVLQGKVCCKRAQFE